MGDFQDPAAPPVRDKAWDVAVTTADPVQAGAVSAAAYYAGRLDDAATALIQGCAAADPRIAARVGYNLGVVVGELGRAEEAVAVYARVVTDYAADPNPARQEAVRRARAMLAPGGVE